MSLQVKHIQNSSKTNVVMLSLPSIAAWQIDHPSFQADTKCMAELPALQRGSVWKVAQVEILWDSIFQGFPLGAFLLSQFDPHLGRQNYKYKTASSCELKPTHMLLDGQQRATGIALGFLNPWLKNSPKTDLKSVLWLDLAPPTTGRDVAYVFRAVTRAHPWGYSISDPDRPISLHQIRLSLQAYRMASAPLYDEVKPHDILLHDVWPWDAITPVPVSLLVHALYDAQGNISQAKNLAWTAIQQLAFMKTMSAELIELSTDASIIHWAKQKETVRQAFHEQDSRLKDILKTLWQRLSSEYIIPANIVPQSSLNSIHNADADATQQSAVETLFIRVNSAGTPLGGEELIYSLIKSSWIEAPSAIESLTHKLATPARIALLASRVVRARHQREQQAINLKDRSPKLRLVATPNVEDFRRLINGQNKEHPTFAQDLQDYVCGDGLRVFEAAHLFLTMTPFGLPPVLASELAQKSPDVFFLLLCWLDRLTLDRPGGQVDFLFTLDFKNNARRVLGFLTALAWFAKAESKPHAVDAIWHDLQTADADQLPDFFNRKRFKKTMVIDTRGKLNMIPLLDPDVLQRALQKCILGYQGCTNTISRPESTIWKDWQWWQWLIDEKRPKDVDEAINPLFDLENNSGEEQGADRTRDIWNQFMYEMYSNKSMLLYAQRDRIKDWFPDFDPSLPEFLEDKNRPWDYDHIHPKSLLQGKNGGTLQGLPQIIKDWHGSIGNLRAWPLEANRSDSDDVPVNKLTSSCQEEEKYGITPENKCEASLISSEDFQKYWSKCVPKNGKKFNDLEHTHPEGRALISAIVYRFLAIYRKWHDDLKLSTLT